jgi:D-arabinitol 4-dehydrogenase
MSSRRILHLGLGAFHRAHQAVYLHRLHGLGDRSWTLAAGNIRADDGAVVPALQRSAGAYTLETVAPGGERSYERITAIGQVFPWEPALAAVSAAGGHPDTRIISFTVSEAGYYLDGRDRLLTTAPELAADLEQDGTTKPRTLYGALAAILRRRREQQSGPVTLLCCDNLRHNGARSRAGLLQFIQCRGDQGLLDWVRVNTSSPNTMVDRITPRPTPDVAERVRAATGQADAASLMAESFIQWVVQDDFIAGRPAWEKVGVQLVDSVDPYEEAKIRLLNASHSCIAWAGTLAGFRYIHEGARDPRIYRLAHDYITEDAIPALGGSPLDLPGYRDQVLERFGNPALGDTNQRVAMDSFAKIPAFILPTLRDRVQAGQPAAATAVLALLFLGFLQRWHRGELPFVHDDQAMDPAQAHAVCTAADPPTALAHLSALWGPLAGHPALLGAFRAAQQRLPPMA